MIDTVVITLDPRSYQITHPDKFTPSANLIWGIESGVQARQNPTRKELRSGLYKPKLTLSNRLNHLRQRNIALKIELSLPKLLFNNNFDELKYSDFSAITNKLAAILTQMGINTTSEILAVR